MFEYELNDTVYFMCGNVVTTGEVVSRQYLDTKKFSEINYRVKYLGDTLFWFMPSSIFKTKDDLLASL